MRKFDSDSYLDDSERRQITAHPDGMHLGRAVELVVQLSNTPLRSERDVRAAIDVLRRVKVDNLPAIIKSLANVTTLLMAARQAPVPRAKKIEERSNALGAWQVKSLAKMGLDGEAVGLNADDSGFLADFVTAHRKQTKDPRQTPAGEIRTILEGYFKGIDTLEVGSQFGLTRSATAQRINATINWIAENRDHDQLRSAFEQSLAFYREHGRIEPAPLTAIAGPSAVMSAEAIDASVSETLPRFQSVASSWSDYIGLDEEGAAALARYLDPQSTDNSTELDPTKRSAIESIVYAGRRHFDSLDNPFLDLSREEQFRLRQVTGGWYERRANDAATLPKPLSETLRFAPLKSAPGIEDLTFSALERLLEAVKTKDRVIGQISA